jgi:hypothetical protein
VFSKRKTQEPKKKKKKKKKTDPKRTTLFQKIRWEIDITWLKLRIAKQNSVFSGIKAVAKIEIAVRSRITYLKPRLNGLSS